MMNEPKAMKEVHTIRERIQEKIKNMTENEVSDFYVNATREVEEMYGIKFRRPDKALIRKVV